MTLSYGHIYIDMADVNSLRAAQEPLPVNFFFSIPATRVLCVHEIDIF